VIAIGEELPQPPRRFGNRIGGSDADDVEAGTPRIGDERCLQKSRLA
jgi:hypothetical protein